jgi:competence protein ComEC
VSRAGSRTGAPVARETVSAQASEAGRPSLSPLLWLAGAAWAASCLGTEAALIAWRESSLVVTVVAWLMVAGMAAAALACRTRALKAIAGVVALTMGIALLHGSWLGATAANLESRGLAEWRGTVIADPTTGQFGTTVRVRLDNAPWGLVVLVNWPAGEPLPAYGRRVVLSARLRSATRGVASSDDAFRRGTLVRASPWRVSAGGWAAFPLGPIAAWRADAVRRLEALGSPGSEALASMLFGVPAAGEAVTAMEDARTAGVGWAITASGLHLAAIVLLVERLASMAGFGRRGRVVVIALTVLAVVCAAGLRLSLVRAALVAGVGLLARLSGRRRDSTAALGAVVAGMLLLDPAAAYDTGLALGAVAVGSIGVFGGLARAWVRPVLGRWLSRVVGASLAAQLGVAPMAAALFGGVAVFGPFALLASGPFVAGAVMLGFLGAATGPLARWLGDAFMRGGSLLATLAGTVWSVVARLPGAFVATTSVPGWAGAVWAALAICLWMRWPRPRRSARVRIGAALLAVVLLLSLFPRTQVSTGVVVLDVGQGDAVLIRDGGHAVLVDTGPDPVVLRQALARAGVRALDGLVLTHAHADHTGGIDGLAGIARPAWIGVPDVVDDAVDRLAADCAKRTDAVVRLRRDMTFTVGQTTVRVLWPQGGERMLEANDTSVVLLVQRGGHTALLLGDAEERAQRGALQAWSQPVEMLKVAHHGSPNGAVPSTLAVWRPRLALISVGAGNSFGHPSAAALAALAAVGAVVRRTDREGDLAWDMSVAVQAGATQGSGETTAVPVAATDRTGLCDNRYPERPAGRLPIPDLWTSAWPLPTWRTSNRSISSTAPRSCCSRAPRSVCAIALPPWPISTSTWRPSTGIPPPWPTS